MSERTYHAFLSHNGSDKPAVEELARRLRAAGLEPWLDRWNLVPGEPWQPALAAALDACQTCVVFVGPAGIGPWQNEEMRAAIDRRVRDSAGAFRVIPVLLPGARRDERSRLPTFLVATTWVEFRDSLDDADAFHRLVCGIRGVQPGPGPGEALPAGECPYRGLRVFDVEHAPFFFGREALTGWLLNDLRPPPDRRDGNRFLAVVGASGSGKSSLVRAGLLAALARDEIHGSRRWPQVLCRPGADPVESLAVALAANPALRPGVRSFVGLIDDLATDPRTLHMTTKVAMHSRPDDDRTVVVLDQFEELFTLCADDRRRRGLIDNLVYAATVVGGRTVVVLAMRADFYGKCAAYPTLAAAVSDHNVLVGPLAEAELRQAIERPAWLAGGELEPGLCEALLHDARNQAGALPLLQHALAELWQRRAGRRLTFAAYEAIGRLAGALERRANEVFEHLDNDRREVCRRIFLRLTQPGEGTEDTKRRVAVEELLPADGTAGAVEGVLHALADARLVTVEGGQGKAAGAVVEVAHEALIRGWSKLRQWIDRDREALRNHRRLSADAAEWNAHGREDSYVYHGVRLAVVEEWCRENAAALNPLERDFLEASRAWEKRMAEYRRQDEALRELSRERNYTLVLAQQIQEKMRPVEAPTLPGFDIAAASLPADAVGGDLIDFLPMPDGRLGLVVADVAGHGFAPALLMAHLRGCLRTAAAVHRDIGELLRQIDRVISDEPAWEAHFATLIFAQLDPDARSLVFINAANAPGYVLDPSGAVRATLRSSGRPLGLWLSPESPPAPSALTLAAGETVVLLTDGILEAQSPETNTLFGSDRVLDVVRDDRRRPSREIVQALCESARQFAGGSLQDDATVLVMKVEPPG